MCREEGLVLYTPIKRIGCMCGKGVSCGCKNTMCGEGGCLYVQVAAGGSFDQPQSDVHWLSYDSYNTFLHRHDPFKLVFLFIDDQ